ncbi:unnamed protein product [Lota lota]
MDFPRRPVVSADLERNARKCRVKREESSAFEVGVLLRWGCCRFVCGRRQPCQRPALPQESGLVVVRRGTRQQTVESAMPASVLASRGQGVQAPVCSPLQLGWMYGATLLTAQGTVSRMRPVVRRVVREVNYRNHRRLWECCRVKSASRSRRSRPCEALFEKFRGLGSPSGGEGPLTTRPAAKLHPSLACSLARSGVYDQTAIAAAYPRPSRVRGLRNAGAVWLPGFNESVQTVAPDDGSVRHECSSGNEASSVTAPCEEMRR